MPPAFTAELLEFQPGRRRFLVFHRGVVAVFAISTLQCHDLAGHTLSTLAGYGMRTP
jgi:hypothetical protein